jgi:hypothetical protein
LRRRVIRRVGQRVPLLLLRTSAGGVEAVVRPLGISVIVGLVGFAVSAHADEGMFLAEVREKVEAPLTDAQALQLAVGFGTAGNQMLRTSARRFRFREDQRCLVVGKQAVERPGTGRDKAFGLSLTHHFWIRQRESLAALM